MTGVEILLFIHNLCFFFFFFAFSGAGKTTLLAALSQRYKGQISANYLKLHFNLLLRMNCLMALVNLKLVQE